MKFRSSQFFTTPVRLCAVLTLSTMLAACGGSGSGDDADGEPGGDFDGDFDGDFGGDFGGDFEGDFDNDVGSPLGGGTDEFDIAVDSGRPNPIFDNVEDAACAGPGSVSFDANSSTSNWDDNCQVQSGGTHQISSYSQGIQRIVYCLGFDNGNPEILDFADGDFGPITAAQVTEFQAERGLMADGIVGPETWGALRDTLEFGRNQAVANQNSRNRFGVTSINCFGEVQFFQAVGFDGVPSSWTIADTPNSEVSSSFDIGAPIP